MANTSIEDKISQYGVALLLLVTAPIWLLPVFIVAFGRLVNEQTSRFGG